MIDSANIKERLCELYSALKSELSCLTDIRGKLGDYAHPVFGEGDPCSDLMLIGEAPGREEAQSGHPFVGKAGRTLDELLLKADIDRRDIYLTNAVKYRPINVREAASGKLSYSNRTPTTHEVVMALPTLRSELELIKPRLVVTLGNTPLKAVWAAMRPNEKPPLIGDAHGLFYELSSDELGVSFELCPLYHPASAIYNRSLLAVMEDDIARLKEHYRK